MRATIIAAILCVASPAFAWDGPGMWYRAADDANPGGGGILGTGGGHDHGIKCTDCHVERQQEPALAFALTFSPPLTAGAYAPGTRYSITAKLTGAQLAAATCATANGKNVDGFAAAFEDDTGASSGALAADDGQASPSCALPSPPPAGTTALDGDCEVVFANSTPNTTTWRFSWTAPAAGAVHVSWGAVDGDCDMMSMNDAAVTGTMTLTAPVAAPPFVRAGSEIAAGLSELVHSGLMRALSVSPSRSNASTRVASSSTSANRP